MSKHAFSKTHITNNTDVYFTKTKKIVEHNGDKKVIYAVFLRKDIIYSCKLAIDLIKNYAIDNGFDINIYENYKEGDFVKAEKCLFFIEGSLIALSELETLILQKIGLPCICAYNAYNMCKYLPNISFVSMLARHCATPEMANMAEYGVSVGSNAAKVKYKSKGFLGTSIKSSTQYFEDRDAFGTMPHSLIGYSKSTLEAAKMFHNTYKKDKLTVLVDYFGKEVTDALEVCNFFSKIMNMKNLAVRIDTHKNRYLEGLDSKKSIDTIKKYHPDFKITDYTEKDLEHIIGKGVSIAAIYYLKEKLVSNGFAEVGIVASSGFDLDKCKVICSFNPPIDIIGTGSTLPKTWGEVFATADIISYNGELQVKLGRENLIKEWQEYNKKS